MTIMHLIGTAEFAGTEQMVLTIGQGQIVRGHRVLVTTRERGKVGEYLADQGLQVIAPKIGPVSAPFRVASVCRQYGVDILHSHLTSGTHVANATSLLTGIPVVDHLHVYSKDVSHKVAARRGKLIAVSNSVNEFYRENSRIDPSRIVTVLNGSSIVNDPDAKMDRELARKVVADELKLKTVPRFVTIAARITPQKGQDLFVGAAEKLAASHPDVHFLMVGAAEDPEFAETIYASIRDRGLSDRVHRLGFRRDIAKLLRASEVACVPSRFDPFPLSSLEPMLVGTPLVATRVGGIPECLHRPELGVLVEPESVASLADGIHSLLSDAQWWQCIAENAEAEAKQRYSVHAMLDQIEAVYGSLLTPKREPGTSLAK
ncbi:MAG: glycosyltransferase family 4 protein [Chthonomonas sp.]|nr:glycosyltransferase family 4 protein [Chthonomonas sp.]